MFKVAIILESGKRFFNSKTFKTKAEAEIVMNGAKSVLKKSTKVEVIEYCKCCGKETETYMGSLCKECFEKIQTQSPCYNCNNEYVDACSTCWVTASERGV